MKTYKFIKMYEATMNKVSKLNSNKFVYSVEMEKNIVDEKIESRLLSFKKEIVNEIEAITKDVNELFKFNPIIKEYVSDIQQTGEIDKSVNNKLRDCISLLRKDHDYYMFEHQICVFIVRYGYEKVNIHKDFLDVLENDLSDLKKHFNKKYNKNIDKYYIEERIKNIVSVVKPLIKELSEQHKYENYLTERERLIEIQRTEHFYKPLTLEKLRVIKNFISREDFEESLIKNNFNPCLSAFSHSIEIQRDNVMKKIIERKAKEYYDLV